MSSGEECHRFRVSEGDEGSRLDHFLVRQVPDHSRSFLQALVRKGQVQLGGQSVKTGHLLKEGDEVILRIPAAVPPELQPEDLPLNLVYEDEDLVVVDKAAGMVVHPAAGHHEGTLVHALLHHIGDLSGIGGELRPGIVHRLDKDTSGLMLVAKNDRSHRALSEMIQNRTLQRSYLALVWGTLSVDKGEIRGNIGRDPLHRQKMAVLEEGGKEALTRYSCLNSFGSFSYLRLDLDTGRTHQIRVHLSRKGNPVLGDPLYGGRSAGKKSRKRSDVERSRRLLEMLDRQALHAFRLAFPHPGSGKELEFLSPLPEDIKAALNLLQEEKDKRKEIE
ncbi:MAG: RluA family pseudouridine synthase [Candidatus Krumholzibacteria bacterium]|jgi:23S rRNA pseudouridine1911/1915/1917 synthase|nr:RluA family pseudouridine synthase [Candidatus Krumholzibacteria bacterium]MDP6669936.1 RluA family pseudouridine synthase [Candidatus Krumholzibacteria bacterium]MDP6796655.1 RluA family pseudouridine synthase [Candidatus Krumholzibacteria bacterium]MDP7021291.1 RluA family pseudouridine synthase [Candidatus Krumholzibacteria bacterium]